MRARAPPHVLRVPGRCCSCCTGAARPELLGRIPLSGDWAAWGSGRGAWAGGGGWPRSGGPGAGRAAGRGASWPQEASVARGAGQGGQREWCVASCARAQPRRAQWRRAAEATRRATHGTQPQELCCPPGGCCTAAALALVMAGRPTLPRWAGCNLLLGSHAGRTAQTSGRWTREKAQRPLTQRRAREHNTLLYTRL